MYVDINIQIINGNYQLLYPVRRELSVWLFDLFFWDHFHPQRVICAIIQWTIKQQKYDVNDKTEPDINTSSFLLY